MLDSLLTDLRVAIRSLLKDGSVATTAIVTLGLAMSIGVAVIVVVNAYLFKALPYPGATRLYSVRYAPPGEPAPGGMQKLDWTALDDVIEHPIAWDLDVFYLIGGGTQAEAAPGAWVTPGFVEGLGIRPAVGRGFDRAAFVPNSPQVTLISHRLWQTRFGGDPDIVGREFNAYVSDRPEEAETFVIIGVLPADFWHVNTYTEILAPLRVPTYPYMVRLREGVTPGAASDRISALVRAGSPGLAPEWKVDLVSTHDAYVSRVRPILHAVGGAAGLLLLIAWANVTGLLLIRATRRRKEVAVRLALGARRAAIARLLSLEALLLVAAATAAGLAVCALSMAAIAPLIERELGRPAPRGLAAFAVDGQVMLAAALCGLVVAVAAGLSPLAVSWRADLLQPLQSGGRSATEGRGSQRTRSALIALEVAASLALLAGSLLMIQSVGRLMRVDFGIQGSQVLTTSLTLRQATYPDTVSRAAFHDRVLSRLSTIPGVRSVALANWWPLQARPPQPIEAEGAPVSSVTASIFPVSPDYFGALGIPVVSGRTFAASDGAGERVAIVSETLARRAWPDGRAVGSYIAVAEEDEHGGRRPSASLRIVGTVGDVRQTPADEDLADVYVPLRQVVGRFFFLHVRTSGPPMALLTAVRAAFVEIDPEVSLTNPRPLQAAIDEQVARPKFLAWLLTGFAAVAALVALVGVYGVIAYAVRQREREIAVRIALGAAPARITRLFLRQGSVVLAAGLALGLGGAVAAGRALQSQLFGVSPGDPATLAVSLAAFAAAALLAIWWPASRAAGANPVAALKEE